MPDMSRMDGLGRNHAPSRWHVEGLRATLRTGRVKIRGGARRPLPERWKIMELIVKCEECEREFDLLSEDDAQEWYYGHDCEK